MPSKLRWLFCCARKQPPISRVLPSFVTLPEMKLLDTFAYSMAAIAMITAFLEFMLGKPAQKKLRDRLIDWWFWLSEARWHNFGAVEAVVALAVFDRFVGPRFWSWKRMVASIVIVVFGVFVGLAVEIASDAAFNWSLPGRWEAMVVQLSCSTLFLSISFSITRFLTQAVARLGDRANGFWFVGFLLVQAALFMVWPAIVSDIDWTTSNLVSDAIFGEGSVEDKIGSAIELWISNIQGYLRFIFAGHFDPFGHVAPATNCGGIPGCFIASAVTTSEAVVALIGNGLRLLMALLFVSSFVFRPLIQRPLTLLLARIVEAEKPAFTLVFGGLALAAKFVQEGLQRLG